MITKTRAQRVRELLASLPANCGIMPATDLDVEEHCNGETLPIEIEYDSDGQMLLPMMRGATPAELPTLDA